VGSVGANPPLRVGDLSTTDISNVSLDAVPVCQLGPQAMAGATSRGRRLAMSRAVRCGGAAPGRRGFATASQRNAEDQ
jgi:hypothetical protein